MKKPNAWVFTGDDTLWSNVHDYAYPILDACKLIIDVLGDLAPPVSVIVAFIQEIDLRLKGETNPRTGQLYDDYSMERFPATLVETYREICRRVGRSPVRSVESDLLYTGLKAFDPARHTKNLYPDTISTLNFLQGRGDLILLLTKGDKRVQGRKLSVLDAGNKFFKVRVVEDNKTPKVFQEMFGGLKNVRFFSVGNDYDKDIVPALEAGYRGIWIPVEAWEVIGQLDSIRSKVDWSRCIELGSLRELVERYDEITGDER